jgi:branched-chain amino acid transport system permease protein
VSEIRTLPSPARLAIWPERGAFSLSEALLFAACLALALTVTSPSYGDLMVLSFLWGGLALAWNIAGGYAGLISFGHAAFYGIAAYASTILAQRAGISPWIGMWLAAALAALFGALLALVCARLKGPFFILSTLAISEVVRIAALNWRDLTGGAEGLSILPTPSLANMVFASKTAYALLALAYLALVFLVSKLIERSRYGYYLFAVRDDEDAAGAAGANPLWLRTSAMALSAFLTGLGGCLFAQYFLYLDPTNIISVDLSFQFALLPALGGIGTAIGPVLGAFVITPLSELLRSSLGNAVAGLHLVIYGAVLIVVVLYFPSGLAGALRRLTAGRTQDGSGP